MSIRKGRLTSQGVLAAPVNFPPGTVISFAGSVAPQGWLICDGSAISRTDYASLFAAIGTLWGIGNGSTTFNLPDLEGRFLRGADNGAGVDPDAGTRVPLGSGSANGVGSLQNDNYRSHGHLGPHNVTGNPDGATDSTGTGTWNRSYWRGGFLGSIPATGGNETRPSNCAINYIIKI